ncbi:unnamed protein product [Staurois parvus]|uniref:Uncharacterized protein n=1 Tax=Staurois parvus TaxID=386267 RepID=A0ABN9FU23_9NEOB|nr:unnamed protein product [Staurois parvus]
MLCIELGDVRLGYSCLAMETHSMKVTVVVLLTLQTVGDFYKLCASACAESALLFYMAYRFLAT